MAMHAGIGFSRLVVLVGAGYTGTIMLKNGKLSDVLAELQALLKSEDSDSSSDALTDQVRRLAMEVRNMASSRQLTIINPNSGSIGSITSLAMPAAVLGAAGYGYMWWKGLSFSDLMYVTKQNMANAVAGMTKHLDQVSAALAATKRHLTQRIENLDGKLDEQKEMSKLIKNEVTDVRADLSQIGFDLDTLQRLVTGLDGKIMSLEDKQDYANAGVYYLCNFVGGGKDGKMGDFLKALPKPNKPRGYLGLSETPNLMGLKAFAENFGSESGNDPTMQNDIVPVDSYRKSLTRTASVKG